MSKATEEKLGALHEAVATVLTAQVGRQSKLVEFDEHGEVIESTEMVYDAAPATLAAAIKFLKDNDITCDQDTNRSMNNLRDALEKKQKHSRLTNPTQAAREVEH